MTVFSGCENNHRKTRRVKIEDNNKLVKIEDDGNTLAIKVNIRNTEKPVDYNESFNVRGMNEKQRKNLQTHIIDSLESVK